MQHDKIHPFYRSVRDYRLDMLVKAGILSKTERDGFTLIDDALNAGTLERDWLRSYHATADDHRKRLEKVVDGLVKIKETGADDLRKAVLAEWGHCLSGGFQTPWEMSLADFDALGDYSQVVLFYCKFEDQESLDRLALEYVRLDSGWAQRAGNGMPVQVAKDAHMLQQFMNYNHRLLGLGEDMPTDEQVEAAARLCSLHYGRPEHCLAHAWDLVHHFGFDTEQYRERHIHLVDRGL